MPSSAATDLLELKAKFAAWRSQRLGRQRIPESLWAAAIALLDRYPLSTIRRECGLNAKQLHKRAAAVRQLHQPAKPPQDFIELSAAALLPTSSAVASPPSPQPSCRVILERADGSRLSLCLPVDWPALTAMWQSFIR